MNEILKVNFVDFWPDFQKNDNYFYHLLSTKYTVYVDDVDPDIVFGSYGFSSTREIERYANHRCLKVYYTGESDGPRAYPYDVNITQWRDVKLDTHFRLPLWAFFCAWFDERPLSHQRDPSVLCPIGNLIKPNADFEKIFDQKKKFCSFLYADGTHERNFWFEQVNRISPVESAGSFRNNTGFRVSGRGDQIHKLNYMSEFFFTLAIENKNVNGYLTEKMLHPLSVFSIPIYWGDSSVTLDFNEKCFIDVRNKNPDIVLDEIRSLINDKNLYVEKMIEPRIDIKKCDFSPEKVLNFLENSLEKKVKK